MLRERPIGPDRAWLLLGLPIAIVGASVVGGLVGRLVRDCRDGTRHRILHHRRLTALIAAIAVLAVLIALGVVGLLGA